MTEVAEKVGSLKARAVASSADRENWLAARRPGITATEIAELFNNGKRVGHAGRVAALVKKKINGDPFAGNMYTEWGRLREAAIAEDVRTRTAIEPNDTLFHAEGNPRHLATPDGVGLNFDDQVILSEIKTSRHDLNPDDPKGHFWSTGYFDQVQWQIYVCGAVSARFTWEQHDDDWSEWPARGPRPVSEALPFKLLMRDDIRIDQLVVVADEFLAAYDEALRGAADGVAPEIDDELDTLAVNLLRFRDIESEGKKSKESTWQQMLDRVSGCDEFSQESALARVTWSPGTESTTEVPDVEAAKQADPELFAEVRELSRRWNEHAAKFSKPVTSTSKATLTVTSIKQKAVKK